MEITVGKITFSEDNRLRSEFCTSLFSSWKNSQQSFKYNQAYRNYETARN